METFGFIAALVILVIAPLVLAVVKGSRPPQPLPVSEESVFRGRERRWAVLIPPICGAASVISLRVMAKVADWYSVPEWVTTGAHNQPPVPAQVARVLLDAAVIVPWFVGAYFAFFAARRTRNIWARSIAVIEFVICFLAGSLYLFAMTVGLG